MVVILDPENWKFLRFEPSKHKDKKYDAVLEHKYDFVLNKVKRVPFGAIKSDGIPYDQYKDSTGLYLYSDYDHGDEKRRLLYRARHKGEDKKKFSSGWFSWYFLWVALIILKNI